MFGSRVIMFGATLVVIAYFWRDPHHKFQDKLDASYDYIIVGGGSAGSVLANRLSEDESVKVLLLEAGRDETGDPTMDVPLAGTAFINTEYDWKYSSVPQKHACQSLRDKKSAWPAGKVLGGGSSINCMMYMRGSRYDYDKWEKLGNQGWGYESVLPYFIKAESNTNPKFIESGYHGDKGPLVVTDVRATSISEAFINAGKELGYKYVDLNGEDSEGFMHTQATTKRGRRWSTAKAYLRPAMGRKNLHVAINANVNKLIFEQNKVTGVDFTHNGTAKIIKTKKEVILSAGTVGSAKLLMLSGIGPKQHLEKLKIPVVSDLPVGQNVHDHVMFDGMGYLIKEPITISTYKASASWTYVDYLLFGTGLLSSTCALEGSALIRSKHQPPEDKSPYIQFHMMATTNGQDASSMPTLAKNLNIKDDVFQAVHGGIDRREGVTFLPILLNAKSRGTITLASKDPQEQPIIDPQYLSHPDDVKILLEAVRIGEKLADTAIFKTILGAKSTEKSHPACEKFKFGSNEYWECYIKQNTLTAYHYAGSCKMGSLSDQTTVVDPQLRVKGVKGLRVVDASIFPTSVAGNLNAPVIMVAEKAADIIRGKVTVQSANVTVKAH